MQGNNKFSMENSELIAKLISELSNKNTKTVNQPTRTRY